MRAFSFLALFALPIAVVLTPALSTASIYSWRDANGVVTYSNDPPASPGIAEVTVRAEEAVPSMPSAAESFEAAVVDADQPRMPERSPYEATEGEFISQLVRELGLGEPADAGQAADALTDLRITPPLGEWRFDQPMTPELTIRLRQLTVAAAERGAITITPEQALLAFDSAAALLNVDIPVAADQETVPDDPYPIADMPPLIDFYQPTPAFSPYYIWTPIDGGFWWGYNFFPGYYVLNVGLFCDHYYNHYYGYDGHDHRDSHHGGHGRGARFASIDPGHISHHLNGHIQNHQLRARPSTAAGRTITSPGQPRSPFAPTSPSIRSGRAGLRASRPGAAQSLVSFARPTGAYRTPLQSPSAHARSFTSPSYRSPSYRAYSAAPRWTGRTAFTPPSIRRAGGAGVAPSRPSFRGGMSTTRSAGRSFTGGSIQHSAGGFSQAGSSFRR